METPAARRTFLRAEWRDLLMLNYEIDPEILRPLLPPGTDLDSFGDKTYISLVGFRFLRTKMLGLVPIPFHVNFEEVNLRFYVRRYEGLTFKRGVVFIQEIVPRRAVAWVARLVYRENYSRHRMRHRILRDETGVTADYQWEFNRHWSRIHARASGSPCYPGAGTLEQFITEHYWGYSGARGNGCLEYQVAHPPWQVWTCARAGFAGDGTAFYGRSFGPILSREPDSAFIAQGSAVQVFRANHLD
jgi:uncharacterized protein YqjF (DUF2071 family)